MFREDRDGWEELYNEIVGALDDTRFSLKNIETDYDELGTSIKELGRLMSDLWGQVEDISSRIVAEMAIQGALEDRIDWLNGLIGRWADRSDDTATYLEDQLEDAEWELEESQDEEERLRDEFYEVSQEWGEVKYTEIPRAEAERDEVEQNMIELRINVIPEMESRRDIAYNNWQFFVEAVEYWENLQERADQFVLSEIPDLYSLHL
jgi:hypothetical protein